MIYIVLHEFKNTLFYAELYKRPNNSNNKKYAVYRASQEFKADYFKFKHLHHKKVTINFKLSLIKQLAHKYSNLQVVEFDKYEEAVNYITGSNKNISIIRYDTDRKKYYYDGIIWKIFK